MPTNFDFLLQDPQFEPFAEVAVSAERVFSISQALCATACRTAMEFAVKWVYSVDKSLTMPYEDKLVSLINQYRGLQRFAPHGYDCQVGLPASNRQQCHP